MDLSAFAAGAAAWTAGMTAARNRNRISPVKMFTVNLFPFIILFSPYYLFAKYPYIDKVLSIVKNPLAVIPAKAGVKKRFKFLDSARLPKGRAAITFIFFYVFKTSPFEKNWIHGVKDLAERHGF
jgi:hypothetical protein